MALTLFEAVVIWRHLPIARKKTKNKTQKQNKQREGLREGRRRVFPKSSEIKKKIKKISNCLRDLGESRREGLESCRLQRIK